MFSLTSTAIDHQALETHLADPGSGALVTFVGRVRNSNDGRSVRRLEYEAYEALAVSEGERILAEAGKRFALRHIRCVHRVGTLAIGETAVWIGVIAAHRGEAFAACRFVIDEIKHRVPIWKKEYYADGDAAWVQCHHRDTSQQPAVSDLQSDEFYARQLRLPEVGLEGQQRLTASRVLVVGAGGLGCPALQYLAAAGVGHLGICDPDRLAVSNLHRQPLFDAAQVGALKVDVAAARLRALNPLITLSVYPERVEADNVDGLLAAYELVLDCTDDLPTKFLLNDACVAAKKTLIQAAIHQYEGQVWKYAPAGNAACLRCVWPQVPAPDCVGSCEQDGVLGVVPAVLGGIQGMEALKHILGLPGTLDGETLFVDLLTYRMHRVRCKRSSVCVACRPGATPPSLRHNVPVVVVSAGLNGVALESFVLVDIRESAECREHPVRGYDIMHVPAVRFDLEKPPIPRDRRCLLVCSRGVRSKRLAVALRDRGWDNVFSLAGGAGALAASNLEMNR